jgi:sirohydrochlorin ferrochelatase
MSGTRSPSPRAPATNVLIVAHGQPSDPGPAEVNMEQFADQVSDFLPGRPVKGLTLALPGALEQALAECTSPPMIYPLFMSDGWFTAHALPKRLNGVEARILDPLGLDPGLPALACDYIQRTAASRKWSSDQVTLILAAHGSGRSRNPARATNSFASALRSSIALMGIRIGFVEEDPLIEDVARDAGSQSICLPFFAAIGGHVRHDIPRALTKAGFVGEILEPIGVAPQIPALVANAIVQAERSGPQSSALDLELIDCRRD